MFYLIIFVKPGFSICCISRIHSLHSLSTSLSFTLISNYSAFLECIRFLHFIVRPGCSRIAAWGVCSIFILIYRNGIVTIALCIYSSVCSFDRNSFSGVIHDGSIIGKCGYGAVAGYCPGRVVTGIYIAVAISAVTGKAFIVYNGSGKVTSICQMVIFPSSTDFTSP